ncbi:MAG TPA: hypothetical protein VFX35_12125 [Solirubrobacterales bacterium]|nr:hypothetical protein [Solirubrobacterales bacterium]
MRTIATHGLVSPGDKELLFVTDEPMQVCKHVMQASEQQQALSG